MRAPVSLAILLSATLGACGVPPSRQAAAQAADSAWFTDDAAAAGLAFAHANGMSGGHFMTEIIGSGVALFDYDNDGDLDVFLVQSKGGSRLFRNNLVETHALTFTDVTDTSGITTAGYGMGVATG